MPPCPIEPLAAARWSLATARMLWPYRGDLENSGVLLRRADADRLALAGQALKAAVEAAEAAPEGPAQDVALVAVAEAISALAGALLPADGLCGLLRTAERLVRGEDRLPRGYPIRR